MCNAARLPRAAGRAPWRLKSEPQAQICAGRIHFARALKSLGPPQNRRFCGAGGIGIEKYSDIKEGDVIEAFIMEQIEV